LRRPRDGVVVFGVLGEITTGCITKEVNKMDKSTWAIGGGLLIGLGVGFFLLQTSALAFVGSILAGLGLGLLIAALIPKEKG
jgi:hypothetical protein